MCPTKSAVEFPETTDDEPRMAVPSPRMTSSAMAKPKVSANGLKLSRSR
jgi:hypothetical protein